MSGFKLDASSHFSANYFVMMSPTITLTPNWVPRLETVGTEGDDLIAGDDPAGAEFDFADHIFGLGGDDVLRGGVGEDRLEGRGGDDVLIGGPGRDVLDGGDGYDTADFGEDVESLQFRHFNGNFVASGADGAKQFIIDIERVVGTNHGDVFTLTSYEFEDLLELRPGAGDDTIAVVDPIFGEANDTVRVDYGAAPAAVHVDLGAGTAASREIADADLIGRDTLNGVNLIAGSAFDDVLTGSNSGDDYQELIGGAGADRIEGGGGDNNWVVYGSSPAAARVDLLAGTAHDGFGSVDALFGIQNADGTRFDDVLAGDRGDNILIGGDGDDSLVGRTGDDWLAGGAGDDYLKGGAGFDFADFFGARGAVTIDLDAGLATSLGGETDRLVDVEGAFGGDFDDRFLAAAGAFAFFGGLGDDTLDLSGQTGAALIDTTTQSARTASGEISVFDSVERIVGTRFDDQVFGGVRVFSFDGGAGFDFVSYMPGNQGVLVDLASGQMLGDARGDVLANVEGVVGTVLNDTLAGDGAANALYGEAGDDWLIGGGGRDFLHGGAGVDVAHYIEAAGAVRANLALGEVVEASGAIDALRSIEQVYGSTFDDVLIGDDSANVLSGHRGHDRLVGAGGDDVMFGGRGADIYAVQDVGDQVREAANAGVDRINTWVDYQNVDHVEVLSGKYADRSLKLIGHREDDKIYGSEFDDRLLGWRGSDFLAGLGGDDALIGGRGADRLFGNGGDDVLDGGADHDRLTGQSGADRFIDRPGDGFDVITDFDVTQDILDLRAYGFADFDAVKLAMTNISSGVKLFGADLHIQGVREAQIGEEDVLI